MRYYYKNSFFILVCACFASCNSNLKLDQYMVGGEALYAQHCANCHGKNGEGFQDLYPPLANSDFFEHKDAVICIIKNGSNKSVKVNGKIYDEKMPKNRELYPLDIAQITTFMYNKWYKSKQITEVDEVKNTQCLIAE